ncbi:hypothetical protein [Chelativorans salis]|uniref:Uncharacterized protein n=1 Tax=Chelativorans salis TaxID=2978478 RepID=A0ABT2LXQ1_9HYPH|nr:hypothetical protein [Chelativorans sp. EGI FJ00035]MCT7377974.1 hypothetical protein [Chelativorans sp. EGI FJ00035]
MNTPEWTKPAFFGAVGGAFALAVIGFTWGGWVTSGTANAMSEKAAKAAVVAVLVPHCVERAQSDPRAAEVMAELAAATAYSRRAVIEKAGWATPIGTEKPNRELAQACQQVLISS